MNRSAANRCTRRGPCEERGSGTVLAVGLLGVLVVLVAVVYALGLAAAVNTQAARAADLAALAAADTARGLAPGDPCTEARQVAQHNQAVLEDCRVGGAYAGEVRVQVSREATMGAFGHFLPLPPLRATASARAGPPEALEADPPGADSG